MRIADFGLARALAEAAWTEPQGAVLGTARYASPEQAQGESVDGRADVYSLGLVLIEAVTGRVPFTADTTIATLMARVGKNVVVPEALGPLRAGARRGRGPRSRRSSRRRCPRGVAHGHRRRPAASRAAAAGQRLRAHRRGRRRASPPSSTRLPDEGGPVPLLLDDLDADDDRGPRRRRRWPWAVVVLLLAVGLGGVGALLVNNARTPSFKVPVVVGLTEAQARAAVDQYGWKITTRAARKDGTTPGQVLSSDPATGRSLRKGDTLVLVISQGNQLAHGARRTSWARRWRLRPPS